MAATLPLDLIAQDIIPRLPTKSFIRFKAVCKYFLTVISSPKFIGQHLPFLLSSSFNGLTLTTQTSNELYSLGINSGETSCRTTQLPLPCMCEVPSEYSRLIVAGSFNGILCIVRCFQFNSYSFQKHCCLALINPSTGMFKEICHCENKGTWSIGFGYDDHCDDYKVVMMVYEYNEGERKHQESVKVYSMKADSWREMDKESNRDRGHLHRSGDVGFLIDNHLLHWIVGHDPIEDSPRFEYRIHCFNLRTEQWDSYVPLPDDYVDYNKVPWNVMPWCYLGVVARCLSLFTMYGERRHDDFCVNVWIMKEYGVKDSWMKSFNVTTTWLDPILYARGAESTVNETFTLVDDESGIFLTEDRFGRW